jgi:multidrug efflux pump
VSLIGTFAVMAAMGFSLNNLSLFGLVLAIGIVVDDAIVVVENVQRNIESGLAPLEASFKAMREVSAPIIAVALVLCAVFVPTAFVSGITGQFYRQFALTIAVSTVLSAFNSLTLSPALAALLLRPKEDKPDWFTRMLNFLFGWFFRAFNWTFDKVNVWYVRLLGGIIRLAVVAMLIYLGHPHSGSGILGGNRPASGWRFARENRTGGSSRLLARTSGSRRTQYRRVSWLRTA